MIKNFNYIITIFLIFITISSLLYILYNKKTHSQEYTLKVFKHDRGWGYEIYKNNQPFIHQVYIPAIEGNYAFPNKSSAKKTGLLVIGKLIKNESPNITKEELMLTGIISNDLITDVN
ncbi:MAG: DUF4907 domain-containing protein [Bacteroidales bacterium]|nr:DUF4907 domain-containing protein [Bacteroidales bacterium]